MSHPGEMWRFVIGCALAVAACGARTELGVADAAPPARVDSAALPARTDVIAIAAGLRASAALLADGRVSFWGYELGGWPDRGAVRYVVPEILFTVPGAVELEMSGHGCVRTADGRVACWGDNCAGQLGLSDFEPRLSPVEVPSIDDAIDVAVGEAHSCVVRRSGDVSCWGENDRGQLGHGLTGSDWIEWEPHPGCRAHVGRWAPGPVLFVETAVQVSAGSDHTCVVLRSGEVLCWGSNRGGQLGYLRDTAEHHVPVTVPGLSDAVEVRCGEGSTCARRRSGEVWCWGAIGDGATRDLHVPVRAVGVLDAMAVASGPISGTRCALVGDGEVLCWGANHGGAAGTSVGLDERYPVRLVAGPVEGAPRATRIAIGALHACLLATDASVHCWGAGGSGELGDGDSSSRPFARGVVGLP